MPPKEDEAQSLADMIGRIGSRVKDVAGETFKKPLGPDKETVNLMQEMGWYQKPGDSGWHDMVAGINQSFIDPALKAGDLALRASRLVVTGTGAAVAETAKEVFGMSQGDARRLERDLVGLADTASMTKAGSAPTAAAATGGFRATAQKELDDILAEFGVKDVAQLRQLASDHPKDARNLTQLSGKLEKLEMDDIEAHYGKGFTGKVSDIPASPEYKEVYKEYSEIIRKYDPSGNADAEYVTQMFPEMLKDNLKKATKLDARLSKDAEKKDQ
jgi:hypothetical protein